MAVSLGVKVLVQGKVGAWWGILAMARGGEVISTLDVVYPSVLHTLCLYSL